MRQVRFEMFALLIVFIYTAIHIHEEAYGQLHVWMGVNWGVEGISFARWLFHNAAYFVPALVGGLVVLFWNPVRFRVVGLGILFWGMLNCSEHTFFAIKTAAYTPGLMSGWLFMIVGIAGIIKLKQDKLLTWKIVVGAFVVQALAFWVLPMSSFMLTKNHIGKIVGG